MVNNRRIANDSTSYWGKRKHMIYYKYIDFLIWAFAHDCDSLIDVGAHKTSIIENYGWIPKRYTLDKNITPYTSENVKGIKVDFFDFNPAEKFDFATCLQVLEHIPDVKSFTKKLFAIADRVLISVPYMWEPGAKYHVHDPVDLEKLLCWTGREPTYYVIVTEPLVRPGRDKRIICYYHLENQTINLRKARKRIEDMYDPVSFNADSQKHTVEQLSDHSKNDQQIIKPLQKRLADEQKRNSKLKKEINSLKDKLEKASNKKRRYEREYQSIVKSTSWKCTAPLRKISGYIKNTKRHLNNS